MILEKVISGGQTGADQGGLLAARAAGILTGGWAPQGYRTLNGFEPLLGAVYGLMEHHSPHYRDRTWSNVQDADATVRIAHDWHSPGELCTHRATLYFNRPRIDIRVPDTYDLQDLAASCPQQPPQVLADWIIEHKVKVLNVAGNSEQTWPGIGVFAEAYLFQALKLLQK